MTGEVRVHDGAQGGLSLDADISGVELHVGGRNSERNGITSQCTDATIGDRATGNASNDVFISSDATDTDLQVS